jgi:hypothetical protein
MKRHFHKMLIPLRIRSYEGWIEQSETLYRRVVDRLQNPPKSLKRIFGEAEDEPIIGFSESELEAIAVKLSLLSGPELLPVFEILGLFGVDLWGSQLKDFNIKTLPAQALQIVAVYLKEGTAKPSQ